MRRRSMSMFQGLLCVSLLGAQPLDMTFAAAGNCSALGPLPAVLEVGEGLQQELQSPVAITRLAVGDPKIADVRVNGNQAFLLTGMAPGAGRHQPDGLDRLRQHTAPKHGVRSGPGHSSDDRRGVDALRRPDAGVASADRYSLRRGQPDQTERGQHLDLR